MEGTLIINNQEYIFYIENNLIIFNVDKKEVCQWYINAKKIHIDLKMRYMAKQLKEKI